MQLTLVLSNIQVDDNFVNIYTYVYKNAFIVIL